MRLPGFVLLAALAASPAAGALRCGPVTVTPAVPARARPLEVWIRVQNTGATPLAGAWVGLTLQPEGGKPTRLHAADLGILAPGAATTARLRWTPARSGLVRVTATAGASGITPAAAPPLQVPVVERPVTFAWFGVPRGLRWANLTTTAPSGGAEDLLQRGIFPCQWKGGICYQEWDVERFVESWCDAERGIAIDEYGGDEAIRRTLIEATLATRRRRPDLFIAWWGIGSFPHADAVALKEATDLFMPEIYLNYHSFHLGRIEAAIRAARDAGVLEKTILGLGVNTRADGAPRDPTAAEVRAQFAAIKRHAPEMPGVAFFHFDGATPALRALCDQLCYDYFIAPVLSLAEPPRVRAGQHRTTLTATVRNDGNLPSQPARLRVSVADTGRILGRAVVPAIAPGKAAVVPVSLPPLPHPATLRAAIERAPGSTLLNSSAEVAVAPKGAGRVLAVPADPLAERVLWSAPPPGSATDTGLVVQPVGASGPPVPAQLDREWSRQGPAAVWVPRAPLAQPAYVRLLPRGAAPKPRTHTGRWELTTRHYRVVLEVESDSLVELRPAGAARNLLRTPWQFRAPGVDRFGPATVTEGPVFVKVRVPFATEVAEGCSDYAFFRDVPLIRIRREYRPRRPVAVESTREGAAFDQRGGTFQLQAGVGGEVERGTLQDGSDYRDLLFGYLGASPEPANHHRTGWFDFSWPAAENAGLGVALERRWQVAASGIYDLTRYYDASDWIDLPMVFRTTVTVTEPQECLLWLLPHGYRDLAAPGARSSVGAFLDAIRARGPRLATPL